MILEEMLLQSNDNMIETNNLRGRKFERLLVVDRVNDYISPKGKHSRKWRCVCDCGNIVNILERNLLSGRTKSCGCLSVEIHRQRKKYNSFQIFKDKGYAEMMVNGFNNQEEKVLIDIEDIDLIKDYQWYVSGNQIHQTIMARIGKNNSIEHYNKKTILLYRLIMNVLDNNDVTIDHINRNIYDNRKENLRICSMQENSFNRCGSNTIGVKGVRKVKSGNYQARITYNNRQIYIGTFDTLKEAADAYDAKAKELYGEFAYLNNYLEDSSNCISFECGYN